MSIQLRREQIKQVIAEQFMPEVIANIKEFLIVYNAKIDKEHEYYREFGVVAKFSETPVLDLRKAQTRLIENILYVINNSKD